MGGSRDSRFGDVRPIASTSAFRIHGAHDREHRRDVVLVEATDPDSSSLAALTRLAEAHRDPVHDVIAPTLSVEDDGTVVLDVPACVDLDGLLRIGADTRARASHPEADGFIVTLRDGLIASARTAGRPDAHRFIGTLAFGNVLFTRDGRFYLVGLGHNVAVADGEGRLVARSRIFQAPEISVGGAPSERSDFVAVLMMLRGMLAFVDLDTTIARAISGNSLREDFELVQKILWIERRVVHANPTQRATIERTIEVSDRIRELIRTRPDRSAFERRVASILSTRFGPTESRTRAPLRVEPNGAYFVRDADERVDLTRRTNLAKLLVVLATHRVEHPGASLDVATLCASCWPGERVLPAAAANRVYVAVNGLRRSGLGDDLERNGDGYRIAPQVDCRFDA